MFRLSASTLPLLLHIVVSWELTGFNVEKNYYISSIAVYRSRAFLALPRSVCHNNKSGPTLVETHWTADIFHPSSNLLPGRQKIQDIQKLNQCEDIQDAISLDVETRRHKLWILDKGNKQCHPKIVSFNLFYNIISEVTELKNISGKYLNVITIDSGNGEHGNRAYIARAGKNKILVMSLDTMIWWKLQLSDPSNPLGIIKADFLAISKTSPQLFLTSRDDLKLFVLDLEDSRSFEEPLASEDTVILPFNVTFVGNKLGLSRGLETDFKSGLSYFMTRDYAIVRWLIGRHKIPPLMTSSTTLALDGKIILIRVSSVPGTDNRTSKFQIDLLGGTFGRISSCVFRNLSALDKSGTMTLITILSQKDSSPMEAEYHNVLAQSYEDLPYVSQLFTCPQKGIWALVNKANPEDCATSNETYPALKRRVIRILRYNKFRNEIEKEK